jgi:hypothetical protein
MGWEKAYHYSDRARKAKTTRTQTAIGSELQL